MMASSSSQPRHREDIRARIQRERDDFGRRHRSDNDDPRNRPLEPGQVFQGTVIRLEPYGAFVSFPSNQQHHQYRGLLHISQIRDRERVERVTDVLQLHQVIFVVIVGIEHDEQRPPKIRLSMIGVDQNTGTINADTVNYRIASSAGMYGPSTGGHAHQDQPRQPHHRVQERQRLFREHHFHWKDSAPSQYGNILWERSPSPPVSALVNRKKKEESTEDSSSSSSSSDSSEESRRRRRRRQKQRGRTDSGKRRRTSHRDRATRRKRRRSPSTESSSSSSSSDSDSDSSSSSAGQKQPPQDNGQIINGVPMDAQDLRDAQDFKKAVQGGAQPNNDDTDDDDDEGPMPLTRAAVNTTTTNSQQYGKALLPGEGQALAAYVQQNLRIPRRGEIGYTGDEIDDYEKSGFVMSGSRHARMNAVRIRKENQVYSAEEQRALALITMEENQQKESQLMSEYRTMLQEKQRLREKVQKGGDD